MLFSTIAFIKDVKYIENKLRLNLSDYAANVLKEDMEIFGESEGMKEPKLNSHFINHVFGCYKEDAAASIAVAREVHREELMHILSGLSERDAAVEKLLGVYTQKLVEHAKEMVCAAKGAKNGFSIRVVEDELKYLFSKEGLAESAYYNDRVGLYMRAVLEEYSRLPYAERERFYFREDLNAISRAIKEEKVLKLETKGAAGKKNTMYMKPVGIEQDGEHLYNYLVGMVGSTQAGPWELGVLRLTNIKKATCQERRGVVSDKDKLWIRGEIKEHGVQFLTDSSVKIVVRLTPEGERRYKRMLHLRPGYREKEGADYTFQCTAWQIENYFFKFGHHAKIIEPRYLADKFKRMYQSAARQYE